MSTHQIPLVFEPARVYGSLTTRDRPRVQRLANSIRARVEAYFRAHPAARVTAPELGQALGLRVENCLAPRLSELAREGFLQITDEMAEGAHGVAVRRYAAGACFDGGGE